MGAGGGGAKAGGAAQLERAREQNVSRAIYGLAVLGRRARARAALN